MPKPTKKRNTTPKYKSERIRRERDPIPWRYCLLTLVCGAVLLGGFFWAATRHFSAMNYGIKNAKLRKQKEELEAQQRQLYLAREIQLAPAEIKKAAKKIGLQEITAQSIELVTPKKTVRNQTETSAKEKPEAAKTGSEKNSKEEKKKTEKPEKEAREVKPKAATSGDVRERVAAKK